MASGRPGADVGSLKTLRGSVAIQGEVQAKGAWTQRAGSIGGGLGESLRWERMRRMTGGSVMAGVCQRIDAYKQQNIAAQYTTEMPSHDFLLLRFEYFSSANRP